MRISQRLSAPQPAAKVDTALSISARESSPLPLQSILQGAQSEVIGAVCCSGERVASQSEVIGAIVSECSLFLGGVSTCGAASKWFYRWTGGLGGVTAVTQSCSTLCTTVL